ncbi:hypothetical protein BO83DRAFT_429135 [Aspergillus eucalypticola CBS 122712]|uniref:Uncharacterized protein n=1 Tax=Aspergillus eucalypticola (strain CBS 122712 / IBT 29274) TaxID=1448314 RepID=A0A317V5C0_ASPEC|nr:uncharacterized protein BO83DRAFT_429135 [Aspergillus eucalypticola CBS 122712]PWY68228.1 hypothetical protein BO83DRAFT_429135 [Aspergillus eucalypticola CBS 122712]
MKFASYGSLALCTVLTEAASTIPATWNLASTVVSSVLATKFGTPGNGLIVSAGLGTIHIIETIEDCLPAGESGNKEDSLTCAKSAVSAAVLFGMAYNNYRQVGYWTKREELGGHFAHIDNYFSQMGDDIFVSDVHYQGIPLNVTHLPQTLRKRSDNVDSEVVRALHNSSMPLSFIYQNKRENHVPLLVATNGTHYHIGHLAPASSEDNSSIHQRRGAIDTAFTHVGSGGIKVQCNSKGPVMTEQQAQVFLDSPMSGTSASSSAMSVFLNVVNYATFAGFSFNEWVNGDLSGQWAMEAESNGFGTNWETNWNWCFGVEQASCDKEL